MNELTKLLGDPIEGNEYIIKPINGEFWIEHKHVGSGEPLEQFINKVERWISVDERLPECNWNTSVFVFDPNNPFDNGYCVARFSEFNSTFYINGSDVIHPTHWMPLPESPKKITPQEGERK